MEELFEKHEKEFLKFDRVVNPQSQRSDIHAFILLDKLFPGKLDIVCSAEHDQIWLGVDSGNIAKLTEDQVIELSRCGVMFDSDTESLSMFV